MFVHEKGRQVSLSMENRLAGGPKKLDRKHAHGKNFKIHSYLLYYLSFLVSRRFLNFGPRIPDLLSHHARPRLNTFGTLDLNIFGKHFQMCDSSGAGITERKLP